MEWGKEMQIKTNANKKHGDQDGREGTDVVQPLTLLKQKKEGLEN